MESLPARSPDDGLEPVTGTASNRRLRLYPGELAPDRNPYLVYLQKNRGVETARTMKGCLDRIAEILSPTRDPGLPPKDSGATLMWWVLDYADTAKVSAALSRHGYKPSSVNKHLSALRQVLETCWLLNLMSAEDQRAAAKVKSVKNKRLKTGRDISDKESAKMLAVCEGDGRPAGVRDAAILAVLDSTGARRAEVADMLIEHYDDEKRTLAITGKGDKEREVYLHRDAQVHVERWLALLGASDGSMFRPINRWDQIQMDKKMTPLDIGRVFGRRQKQAGLKKKATTHDKRRTFIGKLLNAKVDIVTVQELVGHASPVTTAGYDPRPAAVRRAAVDQLHMPGAADLVKKPTTTEDAETEGTES